MSCFKDRGGCIVPVNQHYPGVYVQEVSSGVRTISGVSTSITAFIGWAGKLSTDTAQRIFCWQDFECSFGGLDGRSLLESPVASPSRIPLQKWRLRSGLMHPSRFLMQLLLYQPFRVMLFLSPGTSRTLDMLTGSGSITRSTG